MLLNNSPTKAIAKTKYIMINSRELRIGNWVIDKVTNERGQVKQIHPMDNDIYTPIELSPDILEKCPDFEKIDYFFTETGTCWQLIYHGTKYYFQLKEKYGGDNPNCGCIGVSGDTEDARDIDGKLIFTPQQTLTNFAWGIKHLHQLQNLYYCLTNTELIISL